MVDDDNSVEFIDSLTCSFPCSCRTGIADHQGPSASHLHPAFVASVGDLVYVNPPPSTFWQPPGENKPDPGASRTATKLSTFQMVCRHASGGARFAAVRSVLGTTSLHAGAAVVVPAMAGCEVCMLRFWTRALITLQTLTSLWSA